MCVCVLLLHGWLHAQLCSTQSPAASCATLPAHSLSCSSRACAPTSSSCASLPPPRGTRPARPPPSLSRPSTTRLTQVQGHSAGAGGFALRCTVKVAGGHARALCAAEAWPACNLTQPFSDPGHPRCHAVEFLDAGLQTTVQDYPGRVALWSVGVPPSGPMDDLSHRCGDTGLVRGWDVWPNKKVLHTCSALHVSLHCCCSYGASPCRMCRLPLRL